MVLVFIILSFCCAVHTENVTKRYLDSEACGGSIAVKTASRGTIDFPPGKDRYSSYAECNWAIMGKSVSVDFTDINIEDSSSCSWDYIQIYSLRASGRKYVKTPISQKICPEKISALKQKNFTANQDGLSIHFKSDGSVNRRGFTVNWRINHADINSLKCDFERGTMCGWSSVSSDPLTWRPKLAGKSPWKIWGKKDHTTGGSSGCYTYLPTNVSSPRSKGGLTSPLLSAGPAAGRCLTFYYNMWYTNGIFKVIMKYNDGSKQTILQRDGDQGDVWHKATATLMSKRPFSIILEHSRGTLDVETGLAIDDVVVTNRQCPSRLNSCGTNIYGSRKKRDFRSLLKAKANEEEREDKGKKEQKEELKTKINQEKELKLEKRILGGKLSRKGEFPWIAHLRTFKRGLKPGYSQCGGSIIDDEWIVTAAHCLEEDKYSTADPEQVRIYLGEHNTHYGEIEESQFVLIPEKVIFHPDRKATRLNSNRKDVTRHQYDVALLKLKYKLTFTDSVNAVCLPDRSFAPGTDCIAAGWGRDESNKLSKQLLHLNKVIQSDRSCTWSITDDMICAIPPSGVSSICQGDSGGPLVCKKSNKYELAGASSFINLCSNKKRTSSVFADIYYFMPWIKSTIDEFEN